MVEAVAVRHPSLEQRQLAELAQWLHGRTEHIAAGELGLTPEAALLSGLHWAGPPQFPYVYGDFLLPGGGEITAMLLHTAHLCALSRWSGLHHVWGV